MTDTADREAAEIASDFLVYGDEDANARLESAIAAALAAASRRGAEEERELCARIAETHPCPAGVATPVEVDGFGLDIARAIRARTPEEAEG